MPKTNPWFWMYGTWKLICELLVLENNEEINNIITMPQFIWHFFNRKCWTDQCFWQYKVWCPVFYCFVWVYFRVPKWYKCKYMKHYFKKNSDHFIFLFNVWICWYDMLTVLPVYILFGIYGILVIPQRIGHCLYSAVFMFALVINDQCTRDDERE